MVTRADFPLNRGTRQGDPLSAYLFILVLEVMLIQIRENDNIKGINVGNFDIKLSAFADDTYFLTLDTQSLRHIPETCSVFEKCFMQHESSERKRKWPAKRVSLYCI